jgi:hypothetical protein
MSGRSGSATASHTLLAVVDGYGSFALSAAGARILRRAIAVGGAIHVRGHEVRTARTLVSLQLGTLTDDGNFTLGGKVDGERWTFKANPKVSVRP